MYSLKPGLKFLNSKEIKEIKKKLERQYETIGPLDYAFLINEKNKVFVVKKEVGQISLDSLRINTVGVYICEDYGDEVRLSIEGSQIVGPYATKNVLPLDKEKARQWLKGYDVEFLGEASGYVIIKSGNDYMGSAKHKNGTLLNHVPKERRIRASD